MTSRILICGILLCAAGAAGYRIGDSYRMREHTLGQLLKELSRVEEAMLLSGKTLGEALNQRGLKLLSPLAANVEAIGADKAWQAFREKASTDRGTLSALEWEEMTVLDSLWSEMGLLTRRQQRKRFEECASELTRIYEQARLDAIQRSKLYGTLGILLGLVAVVLLW